MQAVDDFKLIPLYIRDAIMYKWKLSYQVKGEEVFTRRFKEREELIDFVKEHGMDKYLI